MGHFHEAADNIRNIADSCDDPTELRHKEIMRNIVLGVAVIGEVGVIAGSIATDNYRYIISGQLGPLAMLAGAGIGQLAIVLDRRRGEMFRKAAGDLDVLEMRLELEAWNNQTKADEN